MRNIQIAAAVSAALLSSGAFALTPSATAAASRLVVAGSSAGRDTFQTEFTNLCQAGTVHLYRATPTQNQDFRAYSCTLLNANPVPSVLVGGVEQLRNRDWVVYYRSEGGSVWGPASVTKNAPIARLNVTASQCQGAGGVGASLLLPPSFNDCPATYGDIDNVSSTHITSARTDLGVSDLEPIMFSGENWVAGGTYLDTFPPAGEPTTWADGVQGFGQAFGVLVSSTLPINSISKQDVASIFQGVYTDWSQVQDPATGSALAAGAITVCRREPGSGTQTGAGVYFLHQNCGISSEPFVTAGGNVIQSSTTSGLETCVGTAGLRAIGPNAYKTSLPTGTKYLSIDGAAPSKYNAAKGTYAYSFESSFQKESGLAAGPDRLADLLISRAQSVAGVPAASPSAFAIPNIGNPANAPILPVANVNTPIAVGTTGGNSCKTALGQN